MHISESQDVGACSADCPVRKTAQILDGKWTILVIRDLLSGKKRYNELERSLKGISPRLLSLRLRTLEQQGIVLRHQYPTNPPTTEYELSEHGLRLQGVIEAMASFSRQLD